MIMGKLRGKPPLYENPQELLEYFHSYIEDEINEGRIPNNAGFTAHCFISDMNRLRYEAKVEYCEVFNYIRNILESETINCKNIDSNTKNLILKSKYKYSDKQEIDLRTEAITIQLTRST